MMALVKYIGGQRPSVETYIGDEPYSAVDDLEDHAGWIDCVYDEPVELPDWIVYGIPANETHCAYGGKLEQRTDWVLVEAPKKAKTTKTKETK